MSRYAVLLTLLVLIGYGAFKGAPLLAGPSLTLTTPQDNSRTDSVLVPISGVASHTENLYLNGALLPIDAQGRFSTVITLPHGGAILSLTATDRFGKVTRLRRSVFVP